MLITAKSKALGYYDDDGYMNTWKERLYQAVKNQTHQRYTNVSERTVSYTGFGAG